MGIENWLDWWESASQHEAADLAAAQLAEVRALVAKGLVQRCFLLPLELGGSNERRNVVWLPPPCAEQKREFDEVVRSAVESGEEVKYAATPEYEDDSLIPEKLLLAAAGAHWSAEITIEVATQKTWHS